MSIYKLINFYLYQLENSFFNSLSVFSVFGTVGGKLAIKYRKENNIVFYFLYYRVCLS